VSVEGVLDRLLAGHQRQFQKFVKATGHRTLASGPLDPADYPGADAALLGPCLPSCSSPRRGLLSRAIPYRLGGSSAPELIGAHPEGPAARQGSEHHPVVHVAFEDCPGYRRLEWEAVPARRSGAGCPWGPGRRPSRLGHEPPPGGRMAGQHLAG